MGGSIPLGQRLVDCCSNALGSVLNGHQTSDGRGNALRLWGPAAQPLICHAPGGFPLHLNGLLSRGFVPARSESSLILGFTKAFPFSRGLSECVMPGGFHVVIGGDFTKIGRHIDFRSPGSPGRWIGMGTSSASLFFQQRPKSSNAASRHISRCKEMYLAFHYTLRNIFRIAIPKAGQICTEEQPVFWRIHRVGDSRGQM